MIFEPSQSCYHTELGKFKYKFSSIRGLFGSGNKNYNLAALSFVCVRVEVLVVDSILLVSRSANYLVFRSIQVL